MGSATPAARTGAKRQARHAGAAAPAGSSAEAAAQAAPEQRGAEGVAQRGAPEGQGWQQGTHAHGLAGRERRVVAAIRHPHLAACRGAHQYAAGALGAVQPSVASRRSTRVQGCGALRISHRRACSSSRSARSGGEAAAGASARAAAAAQRRCRAGGCGARCATQRAAHPSTASAWPSWRRDGRQRLWRAAAVAKNNKLDFSAPRGIRQGARSHLFLHRRRHLQNRHHSPTLPTLYCPASAAGSRLGAQRPCAAAPRACMCARCSSLLSRLDRRARCACAAPPASAGSAREACCSAARRAR